MSCVQKGKSSDLELERQNKNLRASCHQCSLCRARRNVSLHSRPGPGRCFATAHNHMSRWVPANFATVVCTEVLPARNGRHVQIVARRRRVRLRFVLVVQHVWSVGSELPSRNTSKSTKNVDSELSLKKTRRQKGCDRFRVSSIFGRQDPSWQTNNWAQRMLKRSRSGSMSTRFTEPACSNKRPGPRPCHVQQTHS